MGNWLFPLPPPIGLAIGPAASPLPVMPAAAWLLVVGALALSCAVLCFLSGLSWRRQPRPVTPDPRGGHRAAPRRGDQSTVSDRTAYRPWYAA
jgi:hypothetical protein